MNIPISEPGHVPTIEINLQEQIDAAAAALENVTQGRAVMLEALEQIKASRQFAQSAIEDVFHDYTGFPQYYRSIMYALDAILRLNVENSKSMESVMVANIAQYSRAIAHHQGQLDMFNQLRENIRNGSLSPEQVQFPVQ